MEITEELRQYFAQTERHREERSKSLPCPDVHGAFLV
jgi:hypothetical protein